MDSSASNGIPNKKSKAAMSRVVNLSVRDDRYTRTRFLVLVLIAVLVDDESPVGVPGVLWLPATAAELL